MWNYGYDEEALFNLRDSVIGIVKGQGRTRLYIDLSVENNSDDHKEIIPAFGYWIERLPIGSKVLCSIKKPAREDRDVVVTIDSVLNRDDIEMAA